MQHFIGIDPGWSSCGYAIVNEESELVCSGSYIPKESGDITKAVNLLLTLFLKEERGIFTTLTPLVVNIERFVAYRGVQTSSSEEILMFIGALIYAFGNAGETVLLTRAIDWKPKLCKWLVRNKGFNNPFPSFDKKFSLLAAETVSGKKGINDHEADAICLAYIALVEYEE